MSDNVFRTKALTGDSIFTSPTREGTAILRGHPSQARVQPFAGQRECLHFSVIFKTLSVGPAPGIEPTTSALHSSAVLTELTLQRLIDKKIGLKQEGGRTGHVTAKHAFGYLP